MDYKLNCHFAFTCIVFLLICMFYKMTALSSKVLFVNKTGDFIIGGMFPIHVLTEKGNCGSEFNGQTGIQNLEAFLFSREKANKHILKNKNITLGVIAYDTCDSDTQALDRALEFVKFQTYIIQHKTDFICNDRKLPSYVRNHGKLLGVIGGATSSVSIQLASFLRLFKVPQISYSATSPALSDTTRYDYFMRTAASDKYQAKAIVEILKTFEWKYVVGFYEDSSYGIEGFHEIMLHAEPANICIAKSYKVNRYFENEEKYLEDLQWKLNDTLQYNNTEDQIVAVLFVPANIANRIFNIVKRFNLTNKFIWVGSDAWTGEDLEGGVKHALGIQPKIEEIKEFDDYLNSLTTSHDDMNPWFKQYREHVCKNQIEPSIRNTKNTACQDQKYFFKNNEFKKNMNTYAVMDAVYAFAYSLKDFHTFKCGKDTKNMCDEFKNVKAEDLMPYLKKVSFIGAAGQEFRFVNNSGPARYSVMKYTNNVWEEIDSCQITDYSSIDDDTWFEKLSKKKKEYKELYKPSRCSLNCKTGEAKQFHANKCCWTCIRCEGYQYLEVRNQSCVNCPIGQWANRTKTGCEEIPETKVDIGWIISAYIFSCIGMIVTSVVAAIFYWQKQTPLIMASGKELSFVLLLGILMSYLSTFAFVAEPSSVSCAATRTMLGLSYTVVYAAILVKTNRIYRVFNINTSKPKKVRYIDAKSQILITFIIVAVEIIALVMWLILDPAKDTFMYPLPTKKVRLCDDAKDFAYLGALVYPLILMILCVYYAIRTRKTPDGFNETRYITFGSYSFCVLWIAFTSIYFSVTDKTLRIVSLCFASSINATVTLITLFITKTYVVILRPEKNTRENVMSRRRTHSYDTVNINNMNNLSRMASAVSTWHSVNTRFDSDDSQNPTITINQKPKIKNHLSISVVSMNNLDNGSMSSNLTSISAPPDNRHLSEAEVRALSAPFKQSSTDLGDERLKQFLEKHEKPETVDLENSIGPTAGRRSMRSFKSRRKRRRTVKRTRSLDGGNELTIPNIIITQSSQEDNSVKVVKL